MMTKILSILFLALLLCSSAYAGDKFEAKGITYEIYETTTDNGSATGGNVRVVAGAEKYAGDIVIPEKVTYNGVDYSVCEIGEKAFFLCSDLESVKLSDALVTIGSYAFRGTSKLSNVSLPAALKTIKSQAFYDSGLTSLYIPANVTIIEQEAFRGCGKLESIIVDENNKIYDSREDCNAIIKDNVLVVGCQSTNIPFGITTIGPSAFENLNTLVSITIPNSVTSIEEQAFFLCTNLESVKFSDALVTIGSYAFRETSKLTNISLPATLKTIQSQAFYNSGLKSIVSEIDAPFSIDKSVFNGYSTNLYNDATLYVKKGLVSVYKETDGWKEFANIQEIPSDVIYTENDNGTSFTFSLNALHKTATIIGFDSGNDDITIPDKVTYNDQEYDIESINDEVFAHKDIVTITFPQKKQSLPDFTTQYLLKNTNIDKLTSNEQILKSDNDTYLIEGHYFNKFTAMQRVLSFGASCTILEPEDFRKEIINKLKNMRRIYD